MKRRCLMSFLSTRLRSRCIQAICELCVWNWFFYWVKRIFVWFLCVTLLRKIGLVVSMNVLLLVICSQIPFHSLSLSFLTFVLFFFCYMFANCLSSFADAGIHLSFGVSNFTDLTFILFLLLCICYFAFKDKIRLFSTVRVMMERPPYYH